MSLPPAPMLACMLLLPAPFPRAVAADRHATQRGRRCRRAANRTCKRHLADALTCGARVTRLRAALTLDATVSASRPVLRFEHTLLPHAQPIATRQQHAQWRRCRGGASRTCRHQLANARTCGSRVTRLRSALKLDATVSASRLAPGFECTPLGHEQVTAVDAAVCGSNSWRRVTRCDESMEARAALAGGCSMAHGVTASAVGSKYRSSVVYSHGRSSEPRLAVGAHRGDHQRRVNRSIHRGCGRPSCADRSPCRWAARRGPSTHRPPLQHDLPCSRHSVSLVAQSESRSHSRTNRGPSATSATRSSERVLSALELEGGTCTAQPVSANSTGP